MRRIVSWITEYSFRRASLVAVAAVALLGFGAFTATRVHQELVPDIELPILTVVVQSPGASPQQVADEVARPIESAAEEFDNLESVESTAVEGLAVVLLNFEYGTNLDGAEDGLTETLDALPPDADPTVLRFDPSVLPIVEFSLQGELSQSELLELAETDVLPELDQIEGVADVEVVGGAVEEIVVTIDRQSLLANGLTFEQVAAALRENNVIIPSGQIVTEGQAFPLETVSIYQSVEEIGEIPLGGEDGNSVTLGQIAEIETVEGQSVGRNRSNGEPSVGIRVAKEKEANTVDVADSVTSRLEDIEEQLPAGVSMSVVADQSDFITESINGVIVEGLLGAVLAIVVIFVFLANWRTTLVTAVSIPLSLLVAIVLLDRLGYSLNIMTLGGLTIAIGRVIDDSIVVLENIYRHMTQGERTFPAIINGAREVSIAIVGATATTCAVFLPLGFIGGLIGELFISFSLAVVFALLASLLVAVTVIPVLARASLSGKVKAAPERRPGDTLLGRLYTPALRLALGNRWKTLGVAAVLFVASLGLVPFLPLVFFPESGENVITVNVDARPGQTQESVLDQAIQVEELLSRYEVEDLTTVITGASSDFSAIGNVVSGQSPNSATITAELADSEDKQDVAEELRGLIERNLEASDNISVSATGGGFGPSSGIEYTVSAETEEAVDELPDVAARVAEAIREVDDTANVRSDVAAVQPTLQVMVDERAASAVDLTAEQIAASLRALSTDRPVTSALIGEEAVDVRLTISGAEAATPEALAALEIRPGVTLGSVAEIVETTEQTSITRIDGNPAATVSADITSDDTGAVSADVESAVSDVEEPPGIDIEAGGIASDLDEGFTNMLIAIMVSIVLVYVVMAVLFQSWLDPFVILFSLPLAVIGALVALAVTGSPLSISAMIGLLMLVGIVVTNAIVLLEFVIMLRKEQGYTTYEALVEGGQTRLRPILMTAVAAMLALVPLSLGLTEGALIASDLGRVVIGGLFSSTLLTLVVVPVIYSLVDDFKSWAAKRLTRRELSATGATG